MRLRLRITLASDWPRPAIVLTDTPRPGCPECLGEGGWPEGWTDEDGEYAGEDWAACDCWNPDRRWLLVPLPRRRLRGPRRDPWTSDTPPF